MSDNYPQTPPPAPGYGQPPAPGATAPGGYPPPAAPYGAYPPAPRTNTMAIIALIGGIAGLTILPLIGSLAGVIFGHVGLSQLKTSGEQGRGLALAGLIMGYVTIGLGVLTILLLLAVFIPLIAATV